MVEIGKVWKSLEYDWQIIYRTDFDLDTRLQPGCTRANWVKSIPERSTMLSTDSTTAALNQKLIPQRKCKLWIEG